MIIYISTSFNIFYLSCSTVLRANRRDLLETEAVPRGGSEDRLGAGHLHRGRATRAGGVRAQRALSTWRPGQGALLPPSSTSYILDIFACFGLRKMLETDEIR